MNTPIPTTLRCCECHTVKPLTAFHHRNNRARHGRQAMCKDCMKEYTRQWRRRLRQDALKYQEMVRSQQATANGVG